MRGYCGIGIYNVKSEVNTGTLWRSAYSLGADFIFTIGRRYKKQSSDTTATYRHLPLWNFTDFEDFRAHIPYDCQLVSVEIVDRAIDLRKFSHPERAIYLLGPEDGSLPEAIIRCSQSIVKFYSDRCLNVASAGSIILYDRQSKRV